MFAIEERWWTREDTEGIFAVPQWRGQCNSKISSRISSSVCPSPRERQTPPRTLRKTMISTEPKTGLITNVASEFSLRFWGILFRDRPPKKFKGELDVTRVVPPKIISDCTEGYTACIYPSILDFSLQMNPRCVKYPTSVPQHIQEWYQKWKGTIGITHKFPGLDQELIRIWLIGGNPADLWRNGHDMGALPTQQNRKIPKDCMRFCRAAPVPTHVPVETKGSVYFEPHFRKYQWTLDFINNQ